MKTNYLKTGLLAIFIFAFYFTNADTIYSTISGGNWHLPDTWEGGIVPAAADDVVIAIGSTVLVYNTGHECNNLTIEPDATLQNRTNANRTLLVHGNIINNGTLQNSNFYFTIYVESDVTNNGTISINKLMFTGHNNHILNCGSGNPIDCYYFQAADTTGVLLLSGNVEFSNSRINLNGVELEGNGYSVKLNDDSYIINAIISDFTILGKFIIHTGIVFEGEIFVQDTLCKKLNGNINLFVNGNLTNNGLITKPNYAFNIFITGDIVNNGVWISSEVHLTGNLTQSISQGLGNEFQCTDFIDDNNSSDIEALTDLAFNNTEIDLDGSTLIMPVTKGATLSLSDGLIKNGFVESNSGILFMDDDAYITGNIHFSDVTLEGIVQLHGNSIVFEGEIINNAYFRNRQYNNVSVSINGDITNNDTITDSNYYLTLNISGNITNNGDWSNSSTILTGTGTHILSQGVGASFSGNQFTAEALTGIITALTDLTFENTNLDLNGDTLIMPATKGATLSLTDGNIEDGYVQSNNGILFMENGAFIGTNLIISDVTLEGTVQLRYYGIEFEGEIINNAFLRNWAATNPVVAINGNITNNDTITDPNYSLTLNISGNITNNGVWSNSSTILTGTGAHTLIQAEGMEFSGTYFKALAGTGLITANSDISFYKTDVDLNGCELAMIGGGKLSVTGISGNLAHLTDGTLSGDEFEIDSDGNSYFSELMIIPDVVLLGKFRASGNNVDFLGSIDVRDTLNTKTSTHSSITVAGRIINNGVIRNNGSYRLTISCQGHIINNGTWENYRTILDGVDDQLIYLIAGKEITGEFRFDALIDDPPYQWKWNNTDLNSSDFTGETSVLLIWEVPVSTDYIGYFKCYGAADSSRAILIRSGIIIDPVVQLQGPFNGVDMDTELAAQDLIPLEQPFNVAPWNYAGDEVATSIPSDIVDWILVELRETSGGPETATVDSIVMRRALLLRSDGRAVDPYHQTPELKYDITINDDIYMIVWHRNHLGVMSAVPISDGDSPAYYDFSESASQAYGGADAIIDLGNGVYGMMGGDADYNQQITQQDKLGFWESNVGEPCGYEAYDFTLDGQVDNQDKNQTWAKTLGKETQVPE